MLRDWALLGEHNVEILADLGYNPDQIKVLYDKNVVYHEPGVDKMKKGEK